MKLTFVSLKEIFTHKPDENKLWIKLHLLNDFFSWICQKYLFNGRHIKHKKTVMISY